MKYNRYLVRELVPTQVRMLGRSFLCKEGYTCDFSATGAIFTLTCEGESEVKLTFITDADVYFTVYVDGVRRPGRLLVAGGGTAFEEEQYVERTVSACTLPAGEHTVRIVRQSNLWHARTTLVAITTAGTFGPAPAPRGRTIEFIGDSLTCGYGVTPDAPGAPREIAGAAQFCDATQAYSFLTAEALNTEFILCGYSGWGLLWGDNEEDPETGGVKVLRTIPLVYPYCSHRRGTTLYQPTIVPDLVVINLGSNDAAHLKKLGLPQEALLEAIVGFMQQIRTMYGKDIPIVQAYGFDHPEIMDTIATAVERAGGAAAGYYYCPLVQNKEGGNGHPSAAGQQVGAEILTAFIQKHGLL